MKREIEARGNEGGGIARWVEAYGEMKVVCVRGLRVRPAKSAARPEQYSKQGVETSISTDLSLSERSLCGQRDGERPVLSETKWE